jgi:myo-inositol-hexaphosphate 3-phosphohydrolase
MRLTQTSAPRRTAGWAVWLVLVVLATLLATVLTGPPSRAAESPEPVTSDGETVPVSHSGDAMDDPAIWVHPTDPSRSLVLGNDKGGALDTYDLDGSLVQRLTFGSQFWGNVDVRQGVTIGGLTRDLVGVAQRGLRFYTVDPDTRLLSGVTEGDVPIGVNGEGFCMYESPTTDKVYAFSITIAGVLRQFELLDADTDGQLEATLVRQFEVGSEAEGCVADDDTGALYVSEENVALWRYSAEPDTGTTREAVDVLASAGGHLVNDIEGVTIVDQGEGTGFVVVSVQNAPNPNASYLSVYRREAGNDFVKTFRVVDGLTSDDCDRTDGITASTADLGPAFPRGLFVCQDNNNDLPGTSGNQNLKLVRLERVVNLDGGEEPPPPPPPPPPGPSTVELVGQSTSNRNSTSFTVQVPTQVREGDGLLLFASQGNTSVLTGPGAGWTQLGRVVDGSHATTVWRRVATASDPGATVSLASGGTWTKVALTLAGYRGTDPTDPVAAVVGAAEPSTSASHTTPLVPNTTDGALRVSYWSDKNSATTRWTAPAGETVRATTTGSGGGRIGALLTDPDSALTAGTPATTGGLTATTDASTSSATMWTILLRPLPDGPPPNQPPVARFSHSCEDLVCTFDGTASTDPDDGIASWAWDFGDGATAAESTAEHTYATAASYEVSLTVTDDDGATDTEVQTIEVGTPPPPPPPPTPLTFVGQATSNRNSTAVSVQVPAAVQADDALLLFASQGNTLVLGGPGAGWTQVGRVVDGTHATTVWRRVATAADAGSTVRVTSGTTYTKMALTLAAYRGTDPVDPLASVSGAGEPGSSTAHTTPVVPNTTSGGWRISYWSDRNSATTGWTAPAGETVRATTSGSGGGRVSSLLTDPTTGLTAGTPATTGGLTATADAPSSTATTWTVLLRPAG